MTIHRIEHALVMDTDDIPGRGGYAVVGLSPGVTQAERAFVAGNFGISDYLHDPKTEDRVFYSFFRVAGGRRAFVRRFSRGSELRRNNTQRRLIVHTLFLDDEVFRQLYGLPWLLLNARDVLRRDVAVASEGGALAPLEWNTEDGAATGIASRLEKRLANLGAHASLVERTISALTEKARVVLPQDPAHEWVTVLAWSMLPWRDREELPWTQQDSMNIGGVSFALANAASEPPTSLPVAARFATELVRMNIESEDTWRDLQERAARIPLSVRKAHELDAWLDWREALIRLRRHDLRTPEHQVVGDMRKLAATTRRNETAVWIDGEEVLQLIWPNVPAAIAQGRPAALAVQDWGSRLQQSELGAVIFRAAPNARWLAGAAKDAGADALVGFFLAGTEGDVASKPARAAIADWIIGSEEPFHVHANVARLALHLAADQSPAMRPLLERLLETNEGLEALHALMVDRVPPHPPSAPSPPRSGEKGLEGKSDATRTLFALGKDNDRDPSPLRRGEKVPKADEGSSRGHDEADPSVIPSVSRGTWAGGAARHVNGAPTPPGPSTHARDDSSNPRHDSDSDLVLAAVAIALKRGHPNTLPFLRDVFLPRVERRSVTATLARDVAEVLRDDPQTFVRFTSKVSPEIAGELVQLVTQWVFREPERSVPLAREVLRHVQRQEGAIAMAGPLAIALAGAGQPAQVWFEVLLQIARTTDARYETSGKNDFLQTLGRLRERTLDLGGAMDSLIPFLESESLRPGDAVRAVVLLLRPQWASGDSRFANALVALIERATRAISFEEIVFAYATDHARTRPRDVSELVAAFWIKVDPAAVSQVPVRTIDLLASVTGNARKRFVNHWSKKVRTLPESPASDRLLGFVLGERVNVNRALQAELALRDIEQGVAEPRTLNHLDASLFKLHGQKYVDIMATAIETYLGRQDVVSRTVRLLELLASEEVLPTVRLVTERRVLPRAMNTLRRGEWKELRERIRERGLAGHGVVRLRLEQLEARSRMQWLARAVMTTVGTGR